MRDEFEILDARQKAAEQQTADGIYQKVAGADARAPLRQLLTPQEIAFVGRESSLSEAINRFRKLMATGQVVEDDPVVVDRLARLQATDPTAFRAVRLAESAGVALIPCAVIRSAMDGPNIFGACFHCSRNSVSDAEGGIPLCKPRLEVFFSMRIPYAVVAGEARLPRCSKKYSWW